MRILKTYNFMLITNLSKTGAKNVIGNLEASFRQKTMRILSFSRFNTFCKCFLLLTFAEEFGPLWNQHKFLRFLKPHVEILTKAMNTVCLKK